MGWSTTLYTSINFHKKTYNNRYDVEEELDTTNRCIKYVKDELQVLVTATDPKLALSSDWEEKYNSPLEGVMHRYNELMEELDEYYYEKFKLDYLLDKWDECHNDKGLAIEPPEGVFYDIENHQDKSFLDGDFIFTDKHPTQETLIGTIVDKDGNVVDDSKSIIDKDGKCKV